MIGLMFRYVFLAAWAAVAAAPKAAGFADLTAADVTAVDLAAVDLTAADVTAAAFTAAAPFGGARS
jgi:uncharacterized protein YjbI with pentapeptide repeats